MSDSPDKPKYKYKKRNELLFRKPPPSGNKAEKDGSSILKDLFNIDISNIKDNKP